MSAQEIKQGAMALPLSDRVSLAQALWESINAGFPEVDPQTAMQEAVRRDQELDSGAVIGRSHDEAIKAARRSLGCE